MKIIIIAFLVLMLYISKSSGQIQYRVQKKELKNDTAKLILQTPVKNSRVKTIPPVPTSVYTLTSAKINIRTGNDNKEDGANMIFFFREKDGVWGKGTDLFQNGFISEFKVNSNFEQTLDKSPGTTATAYTLDNLQARGLYFAVYYRPNFFTDAWKIEAITVTLEFKDQFGNLHPSFGNRVVQYYISNGLLTNSNWLLKATADGAFFTPSPIIITDKF